MVMVYLGIGSNLGQRRRNIRTAIKKIGQLDDTEVIKVSRLIETMPVGGPRRQPQFLNAALKIKTTLAPRALLLKLKKIEKDLGRVPTVRNGPRPIDVDILLYGDRIIQNTMLTIPHPRMHKRDFVLRPLSEIL